MNKNNPKKVKILWQDAISYRAGNKVPLSVTPMETVGLLVKEDDHFLLIGVPKTVKRTNGSTYPDKQPTFYFIPRGMIENIEYIED